MHNEYYYPNITAHERHRMQNHSGTCLSWSFGYVTNRTSFSDHCMDRIQAILMCHPDYSTLTTMRWTTEDPKPMVDGVRTLRSCIDWDRMIESLQDRVVAEETLGALRNPSLSN